MSELEQILSDAGCPQSLVQYLESMKKHENDPEIQKLMQNLSGEPSLDVNLSLEMLVNQYPDIFEGMMLSVKDMVENGPPSAACNQAISEQINIRE